VSVDILENNSEKVMMEGRREERRWVIYASLLGGVEHVGVIFF
jgi:hypothetical protein